jgi:hypothetical protein
MDFGQHDIGLVGGEKPCALHRRQLERIAQHQHLDPEREQIPAQLLVHHRDFIDDDEIGIGRRGFIVEHEARLALLFADQSIDQAMDGLGALAAALAHHQSGLARERSIFD